MSPALSALPLAKSTNPRRALNVTLFRTGAVVSITMFLLPAKVASAASPLNPMFKALPAAS